VHRGPVPVWLSTTATGSATVIDSVAGSERWGIVVDGIFRGSGPLPFGRQPVLAIGRSRVYVGDANSWSIAVYDLTGRRLAPLVRPTTSLVVTAEDVRAFVDDEVARDGEAERPRIERSVAAMTLPKVHPPYTAILVDAADHVWVRGAHGVRSATAPWSIFSPTGGFVTEVQMPAALQPFEIGLDYVLGRHPDPETDAPQVHVHRVTRPR
jgi:hypothetical protein